MLIPKNENPIVMEKRREPKVFQEEFSVDDIPLPKKYINALRKGVKYPYPVQVVAIGMMFPVGIPDNLDEDLKGKVLRKENGKIYLKQAKNIVICSPTSSGKTFSATVFMLKNLKRGTAIYTCPLKALTGEKYDEFSKKFPMLKIGIMTGEFQNVKVKEIRECNIIVSTYEKLDSLLRNNKEVFEQHVSSVVIDEIHTMGIEDDDFDANNKRGACIDDLIMKLKTMRKIAIMATSATIGNSMDMARWLNAKLIRSKFRPVPLKRGILMENDLEYEDGEFEKFDVRKTDSVARIIAGKVLDGEQIMYVRMTRKSTQSFATKMLRFIKGKFVDKSLQLPIKRAKTDTEEELSRCITYGVAFHHAGLPQEVKTYIEEMFRKGKIRFICSTTTLAAGINLPAKYVLMDWKRFTGYGNYPIPTMEVMQILGRAGRPQYDDIGFGVLVCKTDVDYQYCMENYISNPVPENVRSPLLKEQDVIFHSILGNIGGGYAFNREDVFNLYKGSFSYHQRPTMVKNKISRALKTMNEFEEPIITEKDGVFVLTKLGGIIKKYYVNPIDAMKIVRMIKDSDDLSRLAIVHGISRCWAIPKLRVKDVGSFWDDVFIKVKKYLFYKDFMNARNEDERDTEWNAFKTSVILVGPKVEELVETIYTDEDVTIRKLCYAYGIVSGDLMRTVGVQGNFPWMLGFASAIAMQYGKPLIKEKIDVINYMLRYGISEKLVEICKIKNVGKERGKSLFTNGYCDIETVAEATVADIAFIKVNDKKLGTELAVKIVRSANDLLERMG